MNFRRSRAESISNGKSATPRPWSESTTECLEQWLRIAVGNRQHRDFRNCRCLGHAEALRRFCGANSWCQRVAWIDGHVRDRSALHSLSWAHGTLREDIATRITIVSGI